MSKLSIRRPNLPHHDSKMVNLETIVMGGKTLKKLWVLMGVYNLLRYKLQTHKYVTGCYGESSTRMVNYPT